MNRNSEKLFRLAIETSSNRDVVPQEQSSPTDIKWLKSALQDITGPDKLVEHLKACIAVLQKANTDTTCADCDEQAILEEVADLCENIDLACDLHKIGGFPVILEYLNHTNVKLRYAATEVLVAVSQNNVYCQNALVDLSVLSKLLKLIQLNEKITENAQLSQKYLHGVSCIVRQNKKAFDSFKECNGFECLSTALQLPIYKIQLRCIFLLKNLASEHHEVLKYVHEQNFLPSFLNILSTSDKPDLLEFVLELLSFSCKQYQPFLEDCKSAKNILAKCTNDILLNKCLCNDNTELVNGCEEIRTLIGCTSLSQMES